MFSQFLVTTVNSKCKKGSKVSLEMFVIRAIISSSSEGDVDLTTKNNGLDDRFYPFSIFSLLSVHLFI